MIWEKLGQVYFSKGQDSWLNNSALTPTPFVFDDKIRVYCGFRDKIGVSRIGFVDLDIDDPTKILHVSEHPVLDVGNTGCFDDNGMILGDIIEHEGSIRMYYVGFQIVSKVKFLAFTGLAVSNDKGDTFKRHQETPVMDRVSHGRYIRAIHTIRFEENKFKVWFANGNGWEIIDDKPFPQYNIYYCESKDGISNFENESLCIDNAGDEYRIGRPRVVKFRDQFFCFYTKGTKTGTYTPGFAVSDDGINWIRKDAELNLHVSHQGWDSETLCYPALFEAKGIFYAVYNGNDMGKKGFGLLKLSF